MKWWCLWGNLKSYKKAFLCKVFVDAHTKQTHQCYSNLYVYNSIQKRQRNEFQWGNSFECYWQKSYRALRMKILFWFIQKLYLRIRFKITAAFGVFQSSCVIISSHFIFKKKVPFFLSFHFYPSFFLSIFLLIDHKWKKNGFPTLEDLHWTGLSFEKNTT